MYISCDSDKYSTAPNHSSNSMLCFQPVVQNGHYNAIAGLDRLAIEPEKIKRWREDQQKMLEEKGQ